MESGGRKPLNIAVAGSRALGPPAKAGSFLRQVNDRRVNEAQSPARARVETLAENPPAGHLVGFDSQPASNRLDESRFRLLDGQANVRDLKRHEDLAAARRARGSR